ncbi:serine/threonine-protein kinase [Actinomadura montaniterrae]|uniref:non-specific serine/threonine protein kinase n=1 Tax=Actinomadura montaniterrae TaxID=1803903 RepID=A0A6L3VRI9_9ACTN|nr:serine/threonine-protein kinase [Actinomadura montaniterrae]KAB2375370.1 serine/threonine protein kinase [Actinomadura montaniterrae]
MEPLRAGDPDRVGTYRLLARLGGGGMGRVFLGRSRGSRLVAVKVVRPELAGDERFRERFADEVVAARRVGGFYTAQVVDADPDAEPPWLVTAYVPGPSLEQAVHAHGPLPPATIAVLGAGLAEGLAAIHSCDLVHRDLKPGNVILAEDGPRVIDFGIARALDASHHTRSVIGTPPFMSPEQTYGTEIGPASDVFSLGSVIVHAATGRGPFGEGPFEPLIYRIRHDPPDLDGLPHRLAGLIAGCLDKDPAARPALAEILDHLADPQDAVGAWLPPAVVTDIAHLRDATRTLAPRTGANSSTQDKHDLVRSPGSGAAGSASDTPGARRTGDATHTPAPRTGDVLDRGASHGDRAAAGTKPVRAPGATTATRTVPRGDVGATPRTSGFWIGHWAKVCGALVLYLVAGRLPIMTETWTAKRTGAFAADLHLVFDPAAPWTEQKPAGVSGVSSDWVFTALVGSGVLLLAAAAVALPLLTGSEPARKALYGISSLWAVCVGLISVVPFITLFGDGIGDDNSAYNIRSVPQLGMYALWLATGLAFHAIHQFHRTSRPAEAESTAAPADQPS